MKVRLRSNAARPCDTQPQIEDHRVLSVSVSRIQVRHGNEIEDLALDGPAFGRGWWAVDPDGLQINRWTNGDAVLRLPEAYAASRVLELRMGGNMTYPLGSTDFALDFPGQAVITSLVQLKPFRVSASTPRHTLALGYPRGNSGQFAELVDLLGRELLDTTTIYTRASPDDLAANPEHPPLFRRVTHQPHAPPGIRP
jgi:hypothetical protein